MFTLRYGGILGGRYLQMMGPHGRRNVPYIVRKVKEAIGEVEWWA
jgi:hypothetical protein